MSTDSKEAFGELVGQVKDLRDATGDTFSAYNQMSKAAMADGALDTKTKELIALAMGIARTCDGCVLSHARGAFKAGATREELSEALGVTLMMGGGPSATYAAKALRAYDEFAAEGHI